MKPILECVPNFSEGARPAVIKSITDAIASTTGIKVLNVEPGAGANRTVITFAGEPQAVIEAAFRGIQQAQKVIDMRLHHGEHPRMGATDVCPLIPISGITVEEAIELAEQLAKRVGEELDIPVYLYGYAARSPQRKVLSNIRSGEYEGFKQKILLPEWKPDFGPQKYNGTAGQTVIGVRDFLIAYNVNLNTQSVRRANSVAFDVREAGRVKTNKGETVRDEKGNAVRIPGTLKHVQAIGWYIQEFGFAQVSMNLTQINETPLHRAFEEVEKSTQKRGLRITGSEIVGLVPLQSMLEAGRYFLKRQGRSTGIPEKDILNIAIRTLGLNELYPFKPEEKIIEYALREEKPLMGNLSVQAFCDEVASESPAPGGGSVAALLGALGASLGGMVANLSANKRGWDEQVPWFSDHAERLQQKRQEMLGLIDSDAHAFNLVMEAYRLTASTKEEHTYKDAAIEESLKNAALSPLQIMKTAVSCYPDLKAMAFKGNPNSITDAAVGAMALHAGVQGAAFNVQVNLKDIQDAAWKAQIRKEAEELWDISTLSVNEIYNYVEKEIQM